MHTHENVVYPSVVASLARRRCPGASPTGVGPLDSAQAKRLLSCLEPGIAQVRPLRVRGRHPRPARLAPTRPSPLGERPPDPSRRETAFRGDLDAERFERVGALPVPPVPDFHVDDPSPIWLARSHRAPIRGLVVASTFPIAFTMGLVSVENLLISRAFTSTATGMRSQPLRNELGLICLQIGGFFVWREPLLGGS